jgi:hypothetical protein
MRPDRLWQATKNDDNIVKYNVSNPPMISLVREKTYVKKEVREGMMMVSTLAQFESFFGLNVLSDLGNILYHFLWRLTQCHSLMRYQFSATFEKVWETSIASP